ncbi:MAG TPA: hypothetical protein VGW31_03710 [Hanamia sp.]|nr:hypothetical protein [Hanamia sp.]
MSEKERITQPTMGSNDLGSETPENASSGLPSGTDTQTRLAALSTDKKPGNHINDDEKVLKNREGETEFEEEEEEPEDFLEDDDTDALSEEDTLLDDETDTLSKQDTLLDEDDVDDFLEEDETDE